MTELGVDEVVCELNVEDVASNGGIELGEEIFKALEVATELEGRGVGQDGTEEREVDVGDGGRVDIVGVERKSLKL